MNLPVQMDWNQMNTERIVITGAGFTRSFCPNAPLLNDAIEKTILFATKSQQFPRDRLEMVYSAIIDYCRMFDAKNEKNFDLGDMFAKYTQLENKNPRSEGEHGYLTNFGHFKMAYVSLLGQVTPCSGDTEGWEKQVPDFKDCKEYFENKLGTYHQITFNHDLLLESIFNSFPDSPRDHNHKIQHLHGAINWDPAKSQDITSSVFSWKHPQTGEEIFSGITGSTSSMGQDVLIHPSRKIVDEFPIYKKKHQILYEKISNAKEIVVIGHAVDNNPDLREAISKNKNPLRLLNVGMDSVPPLFFNELPKNIQRHHIGGGFKQNCLEFD